MCSKNAVGWNYNLLTDSWCVSPQTVQKYKLDYAVIADTVYSEYRDYGKSANSFGKSYDSLRKVLPNEKNFDGIGYRVSDQNNVTFEVDFPETISGKEYDYLYLDIDAAIDTDKDYSGNLNDRILTYYNKNEKLDANRLTIYWKDDDGNYNDVNSCTMLLQTGELLVPIGFNSTWRNGNHNGIGVRLEGDGIETSMIELVSVRLLGR